MGGMFKKAAACAVILIVALWALDKLPVSSDISHQIEAGIYEYGALTGQTIISIEGEKTNYLFRDDESFAGQFVIPFIERTGREGFTARISWNENENFQHVIYFGGGRFTLAEDLGIVPYILTSGDMTRLAVMLTDGRVLATSPELEDIYRRHITWNADTSTTSISEIEKIPGI